MALTLGPWDQLLYSAALLPLAQTGAKVFPGSVQAAWITKPSLHVLLRISAGYCKGSSGQVVGLTSLLRCCQQKLGLPWTCLVESWRAPRMEELLLVPNLNFQDVICYCCLRCTLWHEELGSIIFVNALEVIVGCTVSLLDSSLD